MGTYLNSGQYKTLKKQMLLLALTTCTNNFTLSQQKLQNADKKKSPLYKLFLCTTVVDRHLWCVQKTMLSYLNNSNKSTIAYRLFLCVHTHLTNALKGLPALRETLIIFVPATDRSRLGAQCVDMCHSLFQSVQEVFRQAVPVSG